MATMSPMPPSAAFHAEMQSPERSFTASDQGAEDPWAELRRVIIDAGQHLSPDDELRDLSAAERAVIARDTGRQAEIDQLNMELRQLHKAFATASASAQRPATVPTPAEHNAQIRQLEQQHYAAGKALNEEQSSVAKKEVELGRWRGEREKVGKWEVGEEGVVDSSVLRLALLHDAGFRLASPTETNKDLIRLLIRNDAKHDVHSVMVDKTRSKAYWANLAWNLASE